MLATHGDGGVDSGGIEGGKVGFGGVAGIGTQLFRHPRPLRSMMPSFIAPPLSVDAAGGRWYPREVVDRPFRRA